MTKKKLLFAAQDLHMGGVQTSLVNLLNVISDEYDIDLFMYTGGVLEKQIPESVNIIKGSRLLAVSAVTVNEVLKSGRVSDILLRGMVTVFALIFGAEKFYRLMFARQRPSVHYDEAISYFTDVEGCVFSKGTNIFVADYVTADKKTAWIHNDPIHGNYNKQYCRRIYLPFDRIVCVSKAIKEKFDDFLPEYMRKTEVIYNVFPKELIQKRAEEFVPFEKCGCDIITVGRIDNRQKRIDKIADVCRRLKNDGVTDFCWRIVGDGPDRAADAELAKKYGVSDVLVFEGEHENPYPFIKYSDLFALYSATEGFPMVIGETLAVGTHILTTNYAAASEQIPAEAGEIASDDEDFYRRIKLFIEKRIQIV